MDSSYTLEKKLKNGKFSILRIPSKRSVLLGLNLGLITGAVLGFFYAHDIILQELSKGLILVSLLSLMATVSTRIKK